MSKSSLGKTPEAVIFAFVLTYFLPFANVLAALLLSNSFPTMEYTSFATILSPLTRLSHLKTLGIKGKNLWAIYLESSCPANWFLKYTGLCPAFHLNAHILGLPLINLAWNFIYLSFSGHIRPFPNSKMKSSSSFLYNYLHGVLLVRKHSKFLSYVTSSLI